uniref:Uncharacterized protein n=1 Tax=Oryza punctata TaxID=4537 RepID=A0A0E0LYN3_ORYPU
MPTIILAWDILLSQRLHGLESDPSSFPSSLQLQSRLPQNQLELRSMPQRRRKATRSRSLILSRKRALTALAPRRTSKAAKLPTSINGFDKEISPQPPHLVFNPQDVSASLIECKVILRVKAELNACKD